MLTNSQQKTLDLIKSGKNIHIYGEGGTGKSYVIQEYLAKLTQKELKHTIVCAPTGIAAINVKGVTIHRAFSVQIGPLGPNDNPPATVSPILAIADRVIIDEISMCRFDLFQYIAKCIILAEEQRHKKIQLIVIGDFLQLPPVTTDKDREALKRLWGTDYGNGYAFQAPLWDSFKFVHCHLSEILRQSGDPELIENENLARVGDASCIPWFVSNTAAKALDEAIHLVPTNAKAAKENEKELAQYKNDDSYTTFEAKVTGEVSNGDKVVDDTINLAIGVRVMSVLNGDNYQNGSIGTVADITYDDSEPTILVKFDSGEYAEIGRHTWDIESYTVTGSGEKAALTKKSIGKFTQIPLKIAYAITIHKSQGQTFERMILDTACFAPGQLYVGLSRCRTRDGIFIKGRKIKNESLLAAPEAIEFYDGLANKDKKASPKENDAKAPKQAQKAKSKKKMVKFELNVPDSDVDKIKKLLKDNGYNI